VLDPRQRSLCRVLDCAECPTLGKLALYRAQDVAECRTRQSLFCRVPDKKHSAKPSALGKSANSGSDAIDGRRPTPCRAVKIYGVGRRAARLVGWGARPHAHVVDARGGTTARVPIDRLPQEQSNHTTTTHRTRAARQTPPPSFPPLSIPPCTPVYFLLYA
jgi:hypothetical protein